MILFSVRIAYVALATSLVHLYPPKYHTRVLRISDGVLSEDPYNVNCFMGCGSKQHPIFLEFPVVAQKKPTIPYVYKEEHAWCEAQLKQFDDAIAGLGIVIELLENEEDSDGDKSRT